MQPRLTAIVLLFYYYCYSFVFYQVDRQVCYDINFRMMHFNISCNCFVIPAFRILGNMNCKTWTDHVQPSAFRPKVTLSLQCLVIMITPSRSLYFLTYRYFFNLINISITTANKFSVGICMAFQFYFMTNIRYTKCLQAKC